MKQGTVTLAWEGHIRLSQGNNIEMKNEILLFVWFWFGLAYMIENGVYLQPEFMEFSHIYVSILSVPIGSLAAVRFYVWA